MLIDEREQEGFTVRCYALPEDMLPVERFASGDDVADQEIIDKINDGTYAWFMVKVTASKKGIVLGTDYLGGCCYKSEKDFVESDDYYAGMRAEAIAEAKKAIASLCEA